MHTDLSTVSQIPRICPEITKCCRENGFTCNTRLIQVLTSTGIGYYNHRHQAWVESSYIMTRLERSLLMKMHYFLVLNGDNAHLTCLLFLQQNNYSKLNLGFTISIFRMINEVVAGCTSTVLLQIIKRGWTKKVTCSIEVVNVYPLPRRARIKVHCPWVLSMHENTV